MSPSNLPDRVRPAGLAAALDRRLRSFDADSVPTRLWRKDPTLWSVEPQPELADRLGWLDTPKTMTEELGSFEEFAAAVAAEGARDVVLLGMGGSSLAPEVFQRCIGNRPDRPRLSVLDSTHPDAVRSLAGRLTPETTVFVVSSKSGSTLETMSFFRYFWEWCEDLQEDRGDHFVAVTDPGSSLAQLGAERGFRRVFLAPPDVGGRYSALTPFGLLPAALIGADPAALVGSAAEMAADCGPGIDAASSPGLTLGALIGEAARAGRDKLSLVTSPELASFPDWVEQLVAESTGKDGTGILPVVGESVEVGAPIGADRVVVALLLAGSEANPAIEVRLEELLAAGTPVATYYLDDARELGGEIFRWEIATAAASVVLGIHPFNQPDVQLAKRLANEAMGAVEGEGGEFGGARTEADSVEVLSAAMGQWLTGRKPGDFISVQAYLAGGEPVEGDLQRLCRKLVSTTGLAITLGFGPRFLHSTGQLHKGGQAGGFFLQLVDRPSPDLAVPESDFGFARLIAAQATGDAEALLSRERRVLRIDLGDDPVGGVRRSIEAVG